MNERAQQSTAVLGGRPFVHSTADIRGSVVIGRGCWIGPNVCLHADKGRIVIGDNTTLEADCVVYTRTNRPTVIGEWVKIGVGSRIEDATIKDWAVIGKGCVLPSATVVGESALLGDGTAASPGQVIPDRTVVMGRHGRVLEKRLDREFQAERRSCLDRGGHDGAPPTTGQAPRHSAVCPMRGRAV
jgi:carbonic anhydrase/acetyltransferase-like protein (isoleucine patch superfamily)